MEIKILRRVRAESSLRPPRHRRALLDGVSLRVPHRSTEPGRPRHRRGLVPDSLVDFHTQVVCDDEDDPATCRGFLLAVYDHDYSGAAAMFFRRYQRERPEPVTILSGATPEGAAFLAHAHERLLECHVLHGGPAGAYEASTVIGGAASRAA